MVELSSEDYGMSWAGIEFGFPWAVALLPLGAGLWWLARRSAALADRRRLGLLIGVRISMFACLVMALAEPRVSSPSSDRHTIWVVDVSRSVGTAALEEAMRFAEEARLPTVGQSWVLFGGNTSFSPTPPGETQLVGVDPDATDLEAALQFASAIFPSDKARVLAVFSDGLLTTGGTGVDAASSAGIPVFSILTTPPEEPEVLVRSIQAPQEVRVNEPFVVRADIFSDRERRAAVDVTQDDVRVGRRELILRKDMNPVEFTISLAESHSSRLAVGVQADEDTIATNNSATTIVSAAGPSRVLLISETSSPALAQALAPQGIDVEERPAAGVPDDPVELESFDAIILDGVSAETLGPARLRALNSYVCDLGGGLVMLGGKNGLGQGGYDGTPVGDILPLRSEFESQKENPSVALVAVLDRSGSMNGEKLQMAKSAALGAMELLSARDSAGVVVFDGEAEWASELQPAQNIPAIRSRVENVAAGGGTNVAAGLDLAFRGLRMAPAAIKHVILLSDGVSIPGPYVELAEKMSAEGISVSTVGVGGDADVILLEKLARLGGGRFYFTDTPEGIPAIFARETSIAARPGFREEPVSAKSARPVPFLAGVDVDAAPFLLGYVSAKVAPGADLWLQTDEGSPLLASAPAGLGKVVAFASDARDVWASEWLAWPDFGKFWAQVIRSAQRPSDLRLLPARLEESDGSLHLTIDAVDATGRPLKQPGGRATMIFPDGETETLDLQKFVPGTLTSRWLSRGEGAYLVRVIVTSADRIAATRQLAYFQGVPDELLLRGVNPKTLRELADQTGAAFMPSPSDIAGSQVVPRDVSRELWPWLAGIVLVLFLVDVALRRVR